MRKPVAAFLVDPFLRQIETIELEATLPNIYEKLGCSMITSIALGANVFGYLDDEGLLKEDNAYFCLEGERHGTLSQPLAGRMLVFGCDDEGNEASVPSWFTPDKLRVVWIDKKEIEPFLRSFR